MLEARYGLFNWETSGQPKEFSVSTSICGAERTALNESGISILVHSPARLGMPSIGPMPSVR